MAEYTPLIEAEFDEIIPFSNVLPSEEENFIGECRIPPSQNLLTSPKVFLHLHVQVKKQQSGEASAASDADNVLPTDKVAPITGLYMTMWKVMELYVNQKQVSPHSSLQSHISYVRLLVDYPKRARKTLLARTFMDNPDSVTAFDILDGNLNKGFAMRNKAISSGVTLDFYGPLLIDFFLQSRPIVQNTELLIRLFRQPSQFIFMADSADDKQPYRLIIVKAELVIKRLRVTQTTLNHLASHVSSYDYSSLEARPIMITSGLSSNNIELIDSLKRPRKVYLLQISQASLNGLYKANAMHLQHYNISRCNLQLDFDRLLPSKPFEAHMDPDNAIVNYARMYVASAQAAGYSEDSKPDFGIEYLEYCGGTFFVCWNLEHEAPTTSTPGANTNIRLQIEWRSSLAAPIVLLCIFDFEKTLKLMPGQTISVE